MGPNFSGNKAGERSLERHGALELQCKQCWASAWSRGIVRAIRAVIGNETMHLAHYEVRNSGMPAVRSNWAKVVIHYWPSE